MKRSLISLVWTALALMVLITGCGGLEETALVNTLTFDIGDSENLRIDYDADDIYILQSDSSEAILKEYMSEDKKEYYAKISTLNGGLLITEGDRPRRSGFKSYVEIYIPQNYTNSLSLHSTSGIIESEITLELSGDFSVDTTSGTVEASNVKASNIKAASTNGDLSLDNLDAHEINIQTTNATTSMSQVNGLIVYQSSSGKLTASNLYGSGSFNASGDGSIDISFSDVTSDISAYSKNGMLAVTLPNDLAFTLSAKTKEGSIDTSFADQLEITDNTVVGAVGADPDITIELETRNGDIQVSR